MQSIALLVVFAMPAFISLAAERASISGPVTDASGNPVAHATIMVYSAGVKQGYSTFCPTCYTDCGKRTLTGADGKFAIANLNPTFRLGCGSARRIRPGVSEEDRSRQNDGREGCPENARRSKIHHASCPVVWSIATENLFATQS